MAISLGNLELWFTIMGAFPRERELQELRRAIRNHVKFTIKCFFLFAILLDTSAKIAGTLPFVVGLILRQVMIFCQMNFANCRLLSAT